MKIDIPVATRVKKRSSLSPLSPPTDSDDATASPLQPLTPVVPNPTPKLTVSDLPEEKKFPFNEFPSEPIKMTAPETGASGDNASATHVPAYQAMMPPRAKLAPHFDGRYLSDFLREFETAAKLAGLTDSEMCDRVLDYCSHRIRDSYKYDDAAEKLFKGDDW